ENRDVLVRKRLSVRGALAPLRELTNLAPHELRLFAAVAKRDDPHLGALAFDAPQHLAVALAARLRDGRVRDVEDLRAAAVVELQLDDLRPGKETLEVEDVPDLRAAPSVDG